jgi:CheY-like chemotaxis protein
MKNKEIKILIVNDDVYGRGVLKFLLTRERFIVEEATDRKEALEKAKETKPDIIILDGLMPEVDSFQIYKQLKEDLQTQSIPIIFCSATHIEELREKGIDVEYYLEKPYQIEQLYKKIKEVLQIKF